MQHIATRKITLAILIVFMLAASSSPTVVTPQSVRSPRDCARPTYTPHEAILIDGNADLMAQASAESWLGNGTEVSPYLITGYYFYDIAHSIEMNNVDLHWAVVGNEIEGPGSHDVWCGIEVDNSSNGIISGNVFRGKYRGIDIINVANIMITHNTIEDNLLHGIGSEGFINGCLISENTIRRCTGAGVWSPSAYDSEISRNTITECSGGGVQILATAVRCQILDNLIVESSGLGIQVGASIDVDIMHNRVVNGSGRGFYVTSADDLNIYNNTVVNRGDHGMDLRGFSNSLVYNNSIVGCDGIGISIVSGQYSTLQYNNISSSSGYGIKTGPSAGNMTVTRNMLYGNGATAQAADDGGENLYFCNYYDDWTSPDADSNGFVDNPYALEGTSLNEDPYPLADPSVVPATLTTTIGSGSSTGGGVPAVPLELVVVGAGAVIVLIVGVFFLKRRG